MTDPDRATVDDQGTIWYATVTKPADAHREEIDLPLVFMLRAACSDLDDAEVRLRDALTVVAAAGVTAPMDLVRVYRGRLTPDIVLPALNSVLDEDGGLAKWLHGLGDT